MLRKHCEILDPDEIRRIMASTTIGRIATIGADGQPYITPVNFVFYEGAVYFHCAARGEKLDNISRDPRVCFEVDIPLAYIDASFDPARTACNVHQLYHCVIIRGTAGVVPDGPLKTIALDALAAKHEPEMNFAPITADSSAYKRCVVVEIKPLSITGKSDLLQNRSREQRLDVARRLKARNRPNDMQAVKAMGFDPDEI
jgi:uncharacterized protein